jgi:hypothetical protein
MQDELPKTPESTEQITPEITTAQVGPQPKTNKKKWLLVSILLAVFVLCGSAVAYFGMQDDKPATDSKQTVSENEPATQRAVDADFFYYASTYDKTVEFYDVTGAKVRTVTLNTELSLPISNLNVNDHIQVIDNGKRIFFMAGEPDDNQFEVSLKTFELFELVDGTPVSIYKAGVNEEIFRWVVSNDGSMIYMQTTSNDNNKEKGYDNRLIDVKSKQAKALTDYVQDSSTWSSTLMLSNDNKTAGYFFNTAGKLSEVTLATADGKKTIKEYGLSCSGQELFCSLEYPEFLSPDQKYVVWGYTEGGRFGVSIVERSTSKVVSNYSLDTTDEQIGDVHWGVDSAKIGFTVSAFSSAGQERVGRLNRFMELNVGSNEPTLVFSDSSPGTTAGDAYNAAWVQLYGYSKSGEYALVMNENKFKIIYLSDKSITGTVDEGMTDSGKFVWWVR